MGQPHLFKVDLETRAFSLSQTLSSDFDLLYAVASDPVVWQQHPQQDRWKRPVFSAFFQAALDNDLGCFTLRDRARNEVIGSTRFYAHDAVGKTVRLGYTFLSPRYWGSGANREIKDALLEHAFTLVDHVQFAIGRGNLRSRRAIEKLGAGLCAGEGETLVYTLSKERFAGGNGRTRDL